MEWEGRELTYGGTGRTGHPVFSEVHIAHVCAAAAETVCAILDLRWRVGHHATVVMTILLVANIGPAACDQMLMTVSKCVRAGQKARV